MGKVLIGLVGLVFGAIIGTVFGGALIGGGAAGVGIATGLSAGICTTVQAAQEEGIMTADHVDQVLTRAASDMSALSGVATSEPVVGSASECEAVLDRLRDVAGAS